MSTKIASKHGLSPGSLVYIGPEVSHNTQIKRLEFLEGSFVEKTIENLYECKKSTDSHCVDWLDVDGIHESFVIEAIGKQYQIHPLVLEDVMNTRQKPKIDFYDETYLFISLKMLHLKALTENNVAIIPEHVSLILGPDYLISFQEQSTGDIFEPVIERIKLSAGKTRKNGVDYLLFALLDLIIDHYLLILEKIDDKLDNLEGLILKEKRQDPISELYGLKRELTMMRKYVWPLRAMLNELILEDSPLIKPTNLPYFKDIYDHTNQVIDAIDAHRELLTNLMDIHYSTLSNKMNSVMKTLTIYSAIFMPLTFIVGIYGMNFDNMPELRLQNGYFYALGGMGLIVIGLLIYFQKRRWL